MVKIVALILYIVSGFMAFVSIYDYLILPTNKEISLHFMTIFTILFIILTIIAYATFRYVKKQNTKARVAEDNKAFELYLGVLERGATFETYHDISELPVSKGELIVLIKNKVMNEVDHDRREMLRACAVFLADFQPGVNELARKYAQVEAGDLIKAVQKNRALLELSKKGIPEAQELLSTVQSWSYCKS